MKSMCPKMLVIDDDEPSCRLVQLIFAAEGFDVEVANDGEAGLKRLMAEAPDVVLLDLRMPALGGMEVLERAAVAQPEVPIIITTAHGELQSVVRAAKLGAVAYLLKPLDPVELVGVVQKALSSVA